MGFIEGLVDVEMLRLTVHVVPTVRQMNICDKCNTFSRQRDGAIQLEVEIRTAVAARGLPSAVDVDLANTARLHFPSLFFSETTMISRSSTLS